MKEKIFDNEYQLIKNDRLRDSVKVLVSLLPDYFFEIPASSTGKYHPLFSLGNGGLIRHTKVAVRIGYELFSTETFGHNFTSDEKDLMLIALILHDGIKKGDNEEYTNPLHPLMAANFVKENKGKTKFTETEIVLLSQMIESHMGQWNQDYKTGEEILPKPTNKYQKMVHLCDYLSSRKFLDVKFNQNDIDI